MNSEALEVVIGIATVALTVYATRRLASSTGAQTPKIKGEESVYGIKLPFRAVSYAGAVFFISLGLIPLRADIASGRWPVDALFLALGGFCVWFGTGIVKTNDQGIFKNSLWCSHSLRWNEVSEVKVHKRDGGAIELLSGTKKLVVDSRFVAQSHLLDEVNARTQLSPTKD